MHIIKPYETSVTLFHRDGQVSVYKSMKEAYRKLGYRWIAENVGKNFREFDRLRTDYSPEGAVPVSERVYFEREYIMRGDFGQILTAKDFEHLRPSFRGFLRYRNYYLWNGEGPVPGTGCGRKWGRCFRRLSHMAQRRQAALVLKEEGEVAPRAARNARNLPNPWDDYNVAARENRNWKQFRKHQWKD